MWWPHLEHLHPHLNRGTPPSVRWSSHRSDPPAAQVTAAQRTSQRGDLGSAAPATLRPSVHPLAQQAAPTISRLLGALCCDPAKKRRGLLLSPSPSVLPRRPRLPTPPSLRNAVDSS